MTNDKSKKPSSWPVGPRRELLKSVKSISEARNSRDIFENLKKAIRSQIQGTYDVSILMPDWHLKALVPTDHSELRDSSDGPVRQKIVLKRGEGLCWHALETGKTLRVGDVTKNKYYVEIREGTQSEMVTPLRFDEKTRGVVNLESDHKDEFTEDDEILLKELADIAAITLVKREQLRDLKLMSIITEALVSVTNLHETLNRMADEIAKVMRARLCYLFFREENSQRICLRGANKGFEDRVGKLSYEPGEGFTGTVYKTEEPKILTDPKEGEDNWKAKDLDAWRNRFGNEPILALAAAPLIHEGEAVGAICLTGRAKDARSLYFSQNDLDLLKTLSDLITPAVIRVWRQARYEKLLDLQETGLCLIEKPSDWENRYKGKTPKDLVGMPMKVVYANDRQTRSFCGLLTSGKSCYQIYNEPWSLNHPCPWCPVIDVFNNQQPSEMVTHSPVGDRNFMRHFKVIVKKYNDVLTGRECALESTADITEEIELQDLTERLATLREPQAIAKAIAETLGRTFQATEGVILTRVENRWNQVLRFRCKDKKETAEEDGKIVTSLLGKAPGAHPRSDYIRERQRLAPTTYSFERLRRRHLKSQSIAAISKVVRCYDQNDTGIQKIVNRLFSNKKNTKYVVFPVPITSPDTVIIFAEDGKSKYFPTPTKGQAGAYRPHGALEVCNLVDDTIREQKAGEVVANALLKSLADDTLSLEECFKEHVPELLGARGFSLFLYDNSDGLLHLKTTTELWDEQGNKVDCSRYPEVTYQVSSDSLTGWVAENKTALNIPRGRFSEEDLTRLFEEDIRPKHPTIKKPPHWMGKFNEHKETCYLGMPILSADGELMGVCRVGGRKEEAYGDRFSKNDEEILMMCCRMLAFSMEAEHVSRTLEREAMKKAWRQTAGAAAHRIGNTLPPAGKYLKTIRNRHSDDSTTVKMANSANASIRNTMEIISEFEKFLGHRPTKLTCYIACDELVTQTIEACREKNPDADIRIGSLETRSRVTVDLAQIQEVFSSFVRDSKHCAREGTALFSIISCEAESGDTEKEGMEEEVARIRLIYNDTGVGVPDDDKRKIFDPFFTSRGGTGLGLSIAREIVHAHGGEIVENGKCGQGVQFEMTLPVQGANQ